MLTITPIAVQMAQFERLRHFVHSLQQQMIQAQPDPDLLKSYGELLWENLEKLHLCVPETGEHWQICSDDPQIQQFAWELLAHPVHGYLSQTRDLTITRSLSNTLQHPVITPELPLQILLFGAQVQPRLALEQEQYRLQRALLSYRAHVNLVVNYDGCFQKFCELLQQQPWHLVIFSGHTAVSQGMPCLLFESPCQAFDAIPQAALEILFKKVQVQCLVLAACQSAFHPSSSQPSLTQALAAHVPHVIGMRETVLDRASHVFIEKFCQELLRGKNIAQAVQAARHALCQLLTAGEVWRDSYHRHCVTSSVAQWSLPVLYSHNPQAVLLENAQPSEKLFDNHQVYVGRRQELDALQNLLKPAQVIFLQGSAGIGKTTLLRQLQRDFTLAGGEVFELQNLQQLSQLTPHTAQALYVIDALQCSREDIFAAFTTLNHVQLRVIISARHFKNVAEPYRLAAPSFEDFKYYGENCLALYYSNTQYHLLYQTLTGNFKALQLLQNQSIPSTRSLFLQQLAVARRYLQALQQG